MCISIDLDCYLRRHSFHFKDNFESHEETRGMGTAPYNSSAEVWKHFSLSSSDTSPDSQLQNARRKFVDLVTQNICMRSNHWNEGLLKVFRKLGNNWSSWRFSARIWWEKWGQFRGTVSLKNIKPNATLVSRENLWNCLLDFADRKSSSRPSEHLSNMAAQIKSDVIAILPEWQPIDRFCLKKGFGAVEMLIGLRVNWGRGLPSDREFLRNETRDQREKK